MYSSEAFNLVIFANFRGWRAKFFRLQMKHQICILTLLVVVGWTAMPQSPPHSPLRKRSITEDASSGLTPALERLKYKSPKREGLARAAAREGEDEDEVVREEGVRRPINPIMGMLIFPKFSSASADEEAADREGEDEKDVEWDEDEEDVEGGEDEEEVEWDEKEKKFVYSSDSDEEKVESDEDEEKFGYSTDSDASSASDEIDFEAVLESDFGLALESTVGCPETGPLVLEQIIGEGGNSVIFLAVGEPGTLVAVKFTLQFAAEFDLAGSDDLDREFAVLDRLRNVPGVVQAICLSNSLHSASGNYRAKFMVLELLDGEISPEEILSESPSLRAQIVANIAADAFAVIQNLHREMFVHADIHPGAFMRDSLGGLRLIDFGKAMPLAPPGHRNAFDNSGKWVHADNPSLLSYQELADLTPTWKDDLLRFGEALFSFYDFAAYSRAKDRATRGVEIYSPLHIASLIQFKQNLSCASLDISNCPPFLDAYYQAVRGLDINRPASTRTLGQVLNRARDAINANSPVTTVEDNYSPRSADSLNGIV